jgi:uncharacterized protein Veg
MCENIRMRTEAGRRVTQTKNNGFVSETKEKTHFIFDGVSDNGGSETVAYWVVWIRI